VANRQITSTQLAAVGGLLVGVAALLNSIFGFLVPTPQQTEAVASTYATRLDAYIKVCNQQIKWETQNGETSAARSTRRRCDKGIDGLNAVKELGASVPSSPLPLGASSQLPARSRATLRQLLTTARPAPPALFTAQDWAAIGTASVLSRDYAAGLTALNEALKSYPTDAALLNDKGVALFSSGDPSGALEAFKQARNLSPHNPTILSNYTLASFGARGLGAALASTAFWGKQLASSVPLLTTKGFILSTSTNATYALRIVEKTLASWPTNYEVLGDKAVILGKLGNSAAALRLFAVLFKRAPTSSTFYNYARFLIGQDKKPAGMLWLRKAVRENHAYAAIASNDPDFNAIKSDPNFRALTAGEITPGIELTPSP